MSDNKLNRRQMLTNCALGAAAAPVFVASLSDAAFAKSSLKLITKDHPVGKVLKYHDSAKAVPKALQKTKGGHAFAKQNCASCQVYKKTGKVGGSEAGTCAMIPGVLVKSTGWCNGWNPKT